MFLLHQWNFSSVINYINTERLHTTKATSALKMYESLLLKIMFYLIIQTLKLWASVRLCWTDDTFSINMELQLTFTQKIDFRITDVMSVHSMSRLNFKLQSVWFVLTILTVTLKCDRNITSFNPFLKPWSSMMWWYSISCFYKNSFSTSFLLYQSAKRIIICHHSPHPQQRPLPTPHYLTQPSVVRVHHTCHVMFSSLNPPLCCLMQDSAPTTDQIITSTESY